MKFIYTFTEKNLSHLSIRKLLKGWALLTIFGVFVFTLTVVFFNQLFTSKQEEIISKVLHLENNSRRLDGIFTELLIRHHDIINAKNESEIKLVSDLNELDSRFNAYSHEMLEYVDTDGNFGNTISSLGALYQEFLQEDEVIAQLVNTRLVSKVELKQSIEAQEALVSYIENYMENMLGVINLSSSRINKKLNNFLHTDNQDVDNLKEIAELITTSLPLKQRQLEKTSHFLDSHIEKLLKVTHRLVEEENLDVLWNIRENEILHFEKLIAEELMIMRQGLEKGSPLFQHINSIEDSMHSLMSIILHDQDSIYHIKNKILQLDQEIMSQAKDVAQATLKLRSQLEQVAMLADSASMTAVVETRDVSLLGFSLIIVMSALFVLNSLIGVGVLVFRIEQPLEKIKDSMSALSKGELHTRVTQSDFANDEFRQLADDFNQFSQTNEEMISKLHITQLELIDNESRITAILENALVGIVHLREHRFVSVNKKFEEMTGYTRDELIGRETVMVYPDLETHRSVGNSFVSINDGGNYEGEWKIKNKQGQIIDCSLSATLIDKSDPEKGTIWIYSDISERKQNEEQLHYLAKYDTLTSLPNRACFNEKLESNLKDAKSQHGQLALMFLDLDHFKQVNDTLGHNVGDQLLCHVAKQLQDCLRSSDTVARLGGDEFIIILNDLKSLDGVEVVAGKIIASLNRPISLGDHSLSISPSIGISVFPEHGTSVVSLVKNADAAMYSAKAQGRNNYQFYTDEMNAQSQKKIVLESQLNNALANDEFVLHYQPQIDANSKRIVAYEALLRWQNKELGLVSPGDIIPELEESGLIIAVGEWVLHRACEQLQEWHRQGYVDLMMTVNLSEQQFRTRRLVEQVEGIMQEYEFEPHRLGLEITERVFMESGQSNLRSLQKLHDLGVKIMLDDFGSGYSSLTYLKGFPFDLVKIDHSIICDLLTSKEDAAICESIIELGHRLGMDVLAEGVENYEQFVQLQTLGCDFVQGNLFSRPLPAANVFQIFTDDESQEIGFLEPA